MGYFIQADPDCDSERTPDTHTRLRGLSGGGLRYYIPPIGRWASRDPLGDEAMLRRLLAGRTPASQRLVRQLSLTPAYLSFLNEPIGHVDPVGLSTDWEPIIDKMIEYVDTAKDIVKEIADALEKGKANGLTPQGALESIFGQIPAAYADALALFADNQDCLAMLKTPSKCQCAEKAEACALAISSGPLAATILLQAEDEFVKKLCAKKKSK